MPWDLFPAETVAMFSKLTVAVSVFITYILLTVNLLYPVQRLDASSLALPCLCLALGWTITFIFPHSGVAKRAGFLGSIFGISLVVSVCPVASSWRYFAWYMLSLSFFHWSEYIMIALYNPHKLSLESFLLNHSPEYQFAAVVSWAEFVLELWLFPWMKTFYYISLVGSILMVGGEALRKLAMLTAKASFSHIVESKKADDHVLVTNGVYSWFRHPSYVGWFWWSVGTQVTLCNPCCLLGYICVSWRFFKVRIHEEELTLIVFFGEKYIEYQKQVGTGLPFIKGLVVEQEESTSEQDD